ncbi:hypothetical protein BJG92_00366 [Arthrobacter sp. SO5]|uniref:hypothetical protein n=1 Tax=Arthrobacter sp. SO5 TaxID=1897055 RepID=UPI001E2B2E2D|nr:hypothetical protein [Arthrobacter sp. SO5]MCB5272856.1 hypothetical protein [Arthrobacter sp. SO5]
MSTMFVFALAGVAFALLVLRVTVPGIPLKRFARRLTPLDMAVTVAGTLGLILHCTSMFFPQVVAAIPGTEGVAGQINAMGTASMIWYAVPALLVMAGLRRQHPAALALLAASLLAVGITMYNGSPLSLHMATIFAAGVMLAATLFLLGTPPWRQDQHTARS